jgi:hypothetical protein
MILNGCPEPVAEKAVWYLLEEQKNGVSGAG